MTRRDSTLYLFPKALLLLIGVLLLSSPSFAQDPIPTAADPSSAEQETFDLEVTVTGDNFSKDSEVRFLRTGTEDPGGIHVKNVKAQGPKTLKVLIDVSAEATVDDFDIEVMSRGRTGKGTELFRVLEKSTGSDSTPPGEIFDLRVVDSTYWSVTLEWTMPADDGFDASSGPVQTCYLKCAPPGEPLVSCRCAGSFLEDPYSWGNPWSTQVCQAYRDAEFPLLQDTEYVFAVACRDENMFNVSEYVEVSGGRTSSFSEVQSTEWRSQEVPAALDVSLGHAFDLDGDPLIVGIFNGSTRIVRGTWNGSSWAWSPPEDLATSSGAFAMDPWGQPAFAGVETVGRQQEGVIYTYFDGSGWTAELVSSLGRKVRPAALAIAFDPTSGEPVIAYSTVGDRSGDQLYLARRTSSDSWEIEAIVAGAFRDISLAFSAAGEPGVAYGWYIDEYSQPDIIDVAVKRTDGWIHETVTPSNTYNWGYFQLESGPGSDDLWLASDSGLCERHLPGDWVCERREFNNWGAPWFAVDSEGQALAATRGAAPREPGLTLLSRDPVSLEWSVEYVDHYQQYAWPSGPPAWDQLHLGLTSSALPAGTPFLPNSPTLSWAWNVCAESYCESNFAEYHLYFAWKETP